MKKYPAGIPRSTFSKALDNCSSVRKIFEKGGTVDSENLRIRESRMKILTFRISPFSCPKSGEDQKKKKKSLHSNLVRFLAEN